MTNKTPWTAGPWSLARSPKYDEPYIVDTTGKLSLTGNIGGLKQNREANAQLIALAPEMADSLRALVAMTEPNPQWAAMSGAEQAKLYSDTLDQAKRIITNLPTVKG